MRDRWASNAYRYGLLSDFECPRLHDGIGSDCAPNVRSAVVWSSMRRSLKRHLRDDGVAAARLKAYLADGKRSLD